jgi:hypothetical protein
VGGAANGRLVEGIVQEVDVATGRVLFEWRSFDHVGLDESLQTQVTPAGNVDYFHLNSIDIDRDGNLLVSARHTSAVYKVDRRTGAVIWRLGGKKSDWHIDPAATFAFQHDVRRRPDGSITLFDNSAALPGPNVASRGMRIALHGTTKRVSLVEQWSPAVARAGWAMGNVQQLDDGGVFIGWGTDGSFSEFGPDGRLRFDARFGDGSVGYRAYRLDWRARPSGTPTIAVVPGDGGTMTVYASWNGARTTCRRSARTAARVSRRRSPCRYSTGMPPRSHSTRGATASGQLRRSRSDPGCGYVPRSPKGPGGERNVHRGDERRSHRPTLVPYVTPLTSDRIAFLVKGVLRARARRSTRKDEPNGRAPGLRRRLA